MHIGGWVERNVGFLGWAFLDALVFLVYFDVNVVRVQSM